MRRETVPCYMRSSIHLPVRLSEEIDDYWLSMLTGAVVVLIIGTIVGAALGSIGAVDAQVTSLRFAEQAR